MASKAAPAADCGFSIRIVGTNAVFRYHTADPGRYLVSRGADTETVDLARTLLSDPDNEVHGWSDSFRSEIDHWSRLVAVGGGANRQALATFDDGLAAQEVLESLLRGSKPQPERLPVEHTLPTPAEL
ncbi:NTD biosynthesis operon putative oxidoreductase ntdC [Mycobacteroides abscessus subsp. abscessus]|nr:NTD biosynthesis operon putative oxidoreductase ntdC [Mycobacteroides abscessus subsp. abscessus]